MSVIKEEMPRRAPRFLERIHNQKFPDWLEKHVDHVGNDQVPTKVISLARGPNTIARRFNGYIINGFGFRTKDRERGLKTQNSGVVVTAKTSSFARASDRNPVTGDVDYYGVLTDIIELDYFGSKKVVLFRCDWVDVRTQGRGIKKDEFGFTLVNFKQLWHTGRNLYDEPYVIASQAQQVFYVPDPIEPDWHVVIRSKPRDLFEMGMVDSLVDNDTHLQSLPCINHTMEETMFANDDNVSWDRKDVEGTEVDAPQNLSNLIKEDHNSWSESDD